MSPFEQLVERLADRTRSLPVRAQIVLLLGASVALSKDWRQWAAEADVAGRDDLFSRARAVTEAYISGDRASVDIDLLAEVEHSIPSGPSDSPDFTAAQDCWICLDSALRGSLGHVVPADAMWYVLEPLFQAVSERVHGLTDVGSARQGTDEAVALTDPQLQSAISAVERALGLLAESNGGAPGDVVRVASILEAVRPAPD